MSARTQAMSAAATWRLVARARWPSPPSSRPPTAPRSPRSVPACRASAAPSRAGRSRELIERAIDASGYREHVLGARLGRAAAGERPQAAAPRAALRSERGARPAGLPRPRRVSPPGRQGRARRARRRRRAGRRAPDDDPRRQGPGVPGRVRGRPRAPAEHADPRPARGRRARRPAPACASTAPDRAPRSTTRRSAASAARGKPRRRTGSCTWR